MPDTTLPQPQDCFGDEEVQKLLERLSAASDFSPDDYFPTLADLIEQTHGEVTAAAVEQLTQNALYRSRLVGPDIDDVRAPIAFREDLAALAHSAPLLRFIELRIAKISADKQAKSADENGASIESAAQLILDAELRSAFTNEMRRRAKAGELPSFIQPSSRGGDRIETLARDMLSVLAGQRALGGSSYPLTLRQLAALTRPQATEKQVLDAAARNNIFGKRALLAVRKEIDSPTAFHEDAVRLGESDSLLRFLLRRYRTEQNHLHSVSELSKRITTARRRAVSIAFRTSLQRRIEEDELPADIACLWVKGAVRLFFLQDVFPASVSKRLYWSEPADDLNAEPSVESIARQQEFETAFNTAFEKLNRQSGGHNFVSLVDLRAALVDFDRKRFDAGLLRMRFEGRYSLSSTQSRHGIRGVEREAAIQEEGSMLLHVSRRGS
ncbi:MAG: hypothetical protein NXI22_07385 [bacterium]|nr:hypothetical protein [bacterium]